MSYGNALKSYQNTSIKTADTLQLVILCYERAIKDLEIAKQLHENDALEDGYKSIRHAQDIITELLLGLDYDRGGEISTNLSKIYNFMLRELMGVNSSKDTVVYGNIIRMLAELKDAWEQVRKSALQLPSVSMESEFRNWQAMA